MDLGCLDLGCIEKPGSGTFPDSERNSNESVMSASKAVKNKAPKEAGLSNLSALNKLTSQIKKHSHRRSSPLNWFPRKKVDSYLKRKIKLIQEVGGMNSTLDETLGDANPHYSRVLREKMAVREAAHKAIEARKAAMVEASWCRILRAARIESKDAEALLLNAEKGAVEAFEAATAIGVILYDMPDCSHRHYEIETSSLNGEGSATHTVTTSFETAFEVDKQVATAVKTALIKLANCPSLNKDEFKELLRKISQNPETGESNQDLSGFSSEFESDTGPELESELQMDALCSQDENCKAESSEVRQRNYRKSQVSEKFCMTKIVDMMVERLKSLQENELASLATIVATCGLNAALAEAENSKHHDLGSTSDYPSAPSLTFPRRMSSFGAGAARHFNADGQMRRKQVEAELPSLDKFLVKRLTRLEKEVQDAKNAGKNGSGECSEENTDKSGEETVCAVENEVSAELDLGSILIKRPSKFEKEIEEQKKISGNMYEKGHTSSKNETNSSEVVPDLGSILIKHFSRLEKEIGETKRTLLKQDEINSKESERLHNGIVRHTKQDVLEVPSLDKCLVKHVSKLEREVQEARNRRKTEQNEGEKVYDLSTKTASAKHTELTSFSDGEQLGKENINLNKKNVTDCCSDTLIEVAEIFSHQDGNDDTSKEEAEQCLDKILVNTVNQLERDKKEATSLRSHHDAQQSRIKQGRNSVTDCEGLDKILVRRLSRLEKEKMGLDKREEVMMRVKKRAANTPLEMSEGSLDQILVKHKPRLEREKIAAAQQSDDQNRRSVVRREARERELQEAWGGLSLGNSMRPHISRLERDKAAWLKAEEEERRKAMED